MGAVARRAKLTEEQKARNRKEIEARKVNQENVKEWSKTFSKEILKRQKIIKDEKNIKLQKAYENVVEQAKIAVDKKRADGRKLPYQLQSYRDAVKNFDKIYREVKEKQK